MLDMQLIKNNIDYIIKQIKQNIESDLDEVLYKLNTLDKIIQFLSEDSNTRDAIDFITKYKK